MSRISMEQVKHVAHLARLAITEEEAEQFQHQLDQMISFAEQLNELDTDQVKPDFSRFGYEECYARRCRKTRDCQ